MPKVEISDEKLRFHRQHLIAEIGSVVKAHDKVKEACDLLIQEGNATPNLVINKVRENEEFIAGIERGENLPQPSMITNEDLNENEVRRRAIWKFRSRCFAVKTTLNQIIERAESGLKSFGTDVDMLKYFRRELKADIKRLRESKDGTAFLQAAGEYYGFSGWVEFCGEVFVSYLDSAPGEAIFYAICDLPWIKRLVAAYEVKERAALKAHRAPIARSETSNVINLADWRGDTLQ